MDKKPTYEELLKKIQELEKQESEQEKIARALQNRETHLRTLIETIPDLIWLKDPNGVYLACNRKFERLYGAKEEDIVGKTDYDFVSWDLAKFFRKRDKIAVKSGKPVANEEELTYINDGHRELVETIKTPMFDPQGNLIGVLGVSRDITERKRIERDLRFSEERLRLTLEVANIGIWDWNIAKDTWYASPTYYTMLGYEPVSGPSDRAVWLDRVHPDDRNAVSKKISRILNFETNEYHYEARMEHADGSYRWHHVVGYVLERDKSNKPTHLTGLRIDINERVEAETEREKLQAQLTQAQKMESIGRLAGGVAHDFNNMLGVIIGQTELLLNQTDPSLPLFAALQGIWKAADNSANLTRQLLAFARKQAISPSILDLNDVVESMLNMLQRIIGEDIHLVWSPEKQMGQIMMDAGQINQILANLCVNARDSIAGIGKIVIETGNRIFDSAYCKGHPEFIPGEYVMLAISDSGCGMDRKTINNIFEPFFTTKREGMGTGLGLATVYGIVKQNNGFINVYSEPGHGSTLKIYLPRHISKVADQPEDITVPPMTRGSETILVVEDNGEILKIIQVMLESRGYTVLSTDSPGDALRLVDEHVGTIDLLLTDVIMPEMNGRDLANRLQSRCPGMKRLYMSGYAANIVAYHDAADREINFIQKPFSMRELSAKVREVMKQD